MKITKEMVSKVHELRLKGLSLRKIGDDLGFKNAQSVSWILKRYSNPEEFIEETKERKIIELNGIIYKLREDNKRLKSKLQKVHDLTKTLIN